ncbi:hypothetical protein [Corynebacterium glucuronolyticum]|uniref:hypothetical protein n=1 Tax=Corynebacterium glucuronolyticum TaxID=39791 RepID=UPI00223BC4A8|nr:hypothetical protein [Corynebacterium glucuronolyticum]
MPLNANNKSYRLADMSIQPDGEVPYPDPDESKDPDTTCIENAEFCTAVYARTWETAGGSVKHFAIMLSVTAGHPDYKFCKEIKGAAPNFAQVRRTDTWHSTVHSHQFFLHSSDEEIEVHQQLAGGSREERSQHTVSGTFKKYYTEMLYDPFDYLKYWKEGKQ